MSGGIVKKTTGTLSLLFLFLIEGYPQETSPPIRFMFYNIENLFDTYDDSLTDDNEFLPGGLRRWNYQRYNRKISSVYKTIMAAGEWEPPAVVAFCEIENIRVLEDLVYGTYLSKYDYKIVHDDSPDARGIDVCLIYRKDITEIIDYSYFQPAGINKEEYNTRNVLYARFVIRSDTIHLFVNHWPSRRGGVLAGEPLRVRIAETVRSKLDSINESENGNARIIVMGDFNATPDDQVIGILTGSLKISSLMINLSEKLQGTYRYMGTWETIDQVIVSGMLINCRDGIFTDPGLVKVFRPDFLLKRDLKYPGLSPFSTYSGYKYQGGYSDHLPVLLDLKSR
ncbi:MAG: endonuclease [Bacteroidia bacterium]|nr:endonuclease [Bacteroidia bacterium]